MGNKKRRFRRFLDVGEFALRIAHEGGIGDRKILKRIFRNTDQRFVVFAILGEKIEDETGGGFTFAAIFKWIKDHPEEFKQLIAMIVALFAGV